MNNRLNILCFQTRHEFVGWNTSSAIMPAHDVTLVAVWEPSEQSYVINYYYEQTDGTYKKEFDEEKQAKTDTLVDISGNDFGSRTLFAEWRIERIDGTIPAKERLS